MLARRPTSAATAQPNGEIRALQQPTAERRSSPRPWHPDPAAEEQQHRLSLFHLFQCHPFLDQCLRCRPLFRRRSLNHQLPCHRGSRLNPHKHSVDLRRWFLCDLRREAPCRVVCVLSS